MAKLGKILFWGAVTGGVLWGANKIRKTAVAGDRLISELKDVILTSFTGLPLNPRLNLKIRLNHTNPTNYTLILNYVFLDIFIGENVIGRIRNQALNKEIKPNSVTVTELDFVSDNLLMVAGSLVKDILSTKKMPSKVRIVGYVKVNDIETKFNDEYILRQEKTTEPIAKDKGLGNIKIKNLIYILKPKFEKEIKNYGITEVFFIDDELHTTSNYRLDNELVNKIAKFIIEQMRMSLIAFEEREKEFKSKSEYEINKNISEWKKMTDDKIIHWFNKFLQFSIDGTNTIIYPEMNEKTNSEIEYTNSYGGGYYLTTDLDLKGQGIKMLGDGKNHKRNKKTYQVTENAFKKIKEKYNTCYVALL